MKDVPRRTEKVNPPSTIIEYLDIVEDVTGTIRLKGDSSISVVIHECIVDSIPICRAYRVDSVRIVIGLEIVEGIIVRIDMEIQSIMSVRIGSDIREDVLMGRKCRQHDTACVVLIRVHSRDSVIRRCSHLESCSPIPVCLKIREDIS